MHIFNISCVLMLLLYLSMKGYVRTDCEAVCVDIRNRQELLINTILFIWPDASDFAVCWSTVPHRSGLHTRDPCRGSLLFFASSGLVEVIDYYCSLLPLRECMFFMILLNL